MLSLVLLLSLVALFGAEDGRSVGRPSLGPAAFPDESWAELASDGEDLWLAVSGYRHNGEFGLRVFQRGVADWKELPAPPGGISQDLPISITVPADHDAAPCLGYAAGSPPEPVIACFEGGIWRPLDLPPLRGGQLVQIATHDGDLVGLIDKLEARPSRLWLLRDIGGAWASTPPISAPPAIAQLAIEGQQESTASFPGIGFATQGHRSQRFVAKMRSGGWRRLQPALRDLGTGPLVGGPVLLGKRILYPVTEADTEPWSFSVQTARIGSTEVRPQRLSTGAGNAQGGLDLVGDRVWATWQEHDQLKTGGFRTSLFAAELTARGRLRQKVRLWRGVSIGPGSIQVVEFQGRTLALYMRAGSNGRGLQATVKRLR